MPFSKCGKLFQCCHSHIGIKTFLFEVQNTIIISCCSSSWESCAFNSICAKPPKADPAISPAAFSREAIPFAKGTGCIDQHDFFLNMFFNHMTHFRAHDKHQFLIIHHIHQTAVDPKWHHQPWQRHCPFPCRVSRGWLAQQPGILIIL